MGKNKRNQQKQKEKEKEKQPQENQKQLQEKQKQPNKAGTTAGCSRTPAPRTVIQYVPVEQVMNVLTKTNQCLEDELKRSLSEVQALNAQIMDNEAVNEISMENVCVFMKSLLKKIEEMEKEKGKVEIERDEIKSEKGRLNGLITELLVNLEEISKFNPEIGESELKENDLDKKLDELNSKVDEKLQGFNLELSRLIDEIHGLKDTQIRLKNKFNDLEMNLSLSGEANRELILKKNGESAMEIVSSDEEKQNGLKSEICNKMEELRADNGESDNGLKKCLRMILCFAVLILIAVFFYYALNIRKWDEY